MDAGSLLDDALEISVVGSFSRIGLQVRRRMSGWADPSPSALDGRTVLVTGPTSGLGRAVAEGVAGLGARVVLVGRDPGRLDRLRDELVARHGTDRFPVVVADMSSATSVTDALARIVSDEPRLDVLVDNAGAIHQHRTITEDGIEVTFATMVANPFRLIHGMLPLLVRGDPGQVIAVTSGGMYLQALDMDDLGSASGHYDGVRAYARAKRAQVSLVREWARRFRGRGVRFDAMHPGWADTPGLRGSLPRFRSSMRPLLRTPREGADTAVWLAARGAGRVRDGRLYLDRRPRPFDRLPWTRVDAPARRALWDRVLTMTGSADMDEESIRRLVASGPRPA